MTRRGIRARLGRTAAGRGRRLIRELIAGPLPDVADDVVETVAVGRERADRRRAREAVRAQVLPWELALPGVGHHATAGREVVAPGEAPALEAAAGGALPLRLRGQR